MNIQKGNTLIAKFIGYTKSNDFDGYEINSKPFHINQLEYHINWNWLMKALDKIENDLSLATMCYTNPWNNNGKYTFSIYKEMDENKDLRGLIVENTNNSKLDATYKTVVDFIEWFNTNKK